jgi:DNA-binding CsgD family transcriptional regulator
MTRTTSENDGARAGPNEALGAPSGIRAMRLSVCGDDFAVLMFPLQRASLRFVLTRAERAVFDAILSGKSNARIAAERKTSVRTVANQVASIFRRAKVSSRVELAAVCAGLDVTWGLDDPNG